MSFLEVFPNDLVFLILEKLPDSDVARCASASRRLFDFAMPVLYRTIHFRLPARFSALDKVIHKLEIFTQPEFTHLHWTHRVIVVGSWYHEYAALESDAGSEYILSPAIRMFSTLIDVCLVRMENLRSFIWDAEIPPTQRLVSRLANQISLTELQLRLGVDDTPHPVLYPPLYYRRYVGLTTIKLNQINSEDVLRTTGGLLTSVRNLKHLYIDADPESSLRFSSIFAHYPPRNKLPLATLYAKGFSDFQDVDGGFWNLFRPDTLEDLTIEAFPLTKPEKVSDFWRMAMPFRNSLRHLCTNVVDHSLVDFLSTRTKLGTLIIKPCNAFEPEVNYQDLIDVTSGPVSELRSLGIYPQEYGDKIGFISRSTIDTLKAQCPHFREIGFGIATEDFSIVEDVLTIPKLEAIHIIPMWMDNEYVSSPVIYLEEPAIRSTGSPANAFPVPGNNPLPVSSRSTRQTRSTTRSLRSYGQTLPPSDDLSAAYPSTLSSKTPVSSMKRLEQFLLSHIASGHAPKLRCVALGHNYPFEVKRGGFKGLRLEYMSALVGSVNRSSLFRYPFLEWARERR